MENMRPRCGRPSDRGRLKNRTKYHLISPLDFLAILHGDCVNGLVEAVTPSVTTGSPPSARGTPCVYNTFAASERASERAFGDAVIVRKAISLMDC